MPGGKLKVRWLKGAIRSLEIEAEYIARDDPMAAAEMVRKIYEAAGLGNIPPQDALAVSRRPGN